MTRLGDFLLFGQAFKAGGIKYFTRIIRIVRQILLRCQNHSLFKLNHFWATFIDIWQFLSGHTDGGGGLEVSMLQFFYDTSRVFLQTCIKYFDVGIVC